MKAMASAALMVCWAGSAAAQSLQPELRVDAVGPSPHAIHAGAGMTGGAGTYTRWTVAAGWGRRSTAGVSRDEWRVDLLARVTLDPFRQQPWGLSFGGGLSVRERTYLAVIAEAEGPEVAGWLPALQLGVAGGFRAGVLVRRAVPGRR